MVANEVYFTAAQAAKMLGVSTATLARWRAEGVGPQAYRIGPRLWRYREADIIELFGGGAR